MEKLGINGDRGAMLSQSYSLKLIGDWGGANFHRICAWLTQEFCDRTGPQSRTSITSIRGGGLESLTQVEDGEADLAIATPAGLMPQALTGTGFFKRPMPHLRALGVLPQNDRLVMALHPKYGIKTFEDLRREKPALRIATSVDDGTNYIGYITSEFLEAHGVSRATLESWGGKFFTAQRPEQCIAFVESGEADAVVQEAIMTPWWRGLIDKNMVVPLPAEPQALKTLSQSTGLGTNILPAGFWDTLDHDLPALDFSDFIVFVRDDMPEDIAYLLTWCLVETRHMIEAQFKHIPPARSPLSYPLDPRKMAQSPVPLHQAAQKYYAQAGHI